MNDCTLKPGDVVFVPGVQNAIAEWSSGKAVVGRIQQVDQEYFINFVDHINVTMTWSNLKKFQTQEITNSSIKVFVKKWFI